MAMIFNGFKDFNKGEVLREWSFNRMVLSGDWPVLLQICEEVGIAPTWLGCRCRRPEVVRLRWEVWRRLYFNFGWTMERIAIACGVDHSAVVWSLKNVR